MFFRQMYFISSSSSPPHTLKHAIGPNAHNFRRNWNVFRIIFQRVPHISHESSYKFQMFPICFPYLPHNFPVVLFYMSIHLKYVSHTLPKFSYIFPYVSHKFPPIFQILVHKFRTCFSILHYFSNMFPRCCLSFPIAYTDIPQIPNKFPIFSRGFSHKFP